MEVICFALGIIIGGAVSGVLCFVVGKSSKNKNDILEAEERKADIRLKKQWANFAAYNGTSKGQEEIE